MQANVLAPTTGMARDEWLDVRRKGIGGSDAAAILGLDPYRSPYTVWADKMGLTADHEDNEAMRLGRDLEDYVAKRFCEVSGKRVRRNTRILVHPEHRFMLANIDREVMKESSGLECKTTSRLSLKKFNGVDFPSEYYCQCVHYLKVTGFRRWYVAVLIMGIDFVVYQMTTIPSDAKPDWCKGSVLVDKPEFEALVQAEADFWNLVESQTPPPVDGTLSTTKTLNAISSEDAGEIELFDEDGDLDMLESINEQVRMLGKSAEQIRQRIKERMGGTGRAVCNDYQIVWANHMRTYIDQRALLRYCPKELLNRIIKAKPYKSFRIKRVEQQCS